MTDIRLDSIEKFLSRGQRLDEVKRRVAKLAEIVDDASLATPFMKPVGN